jgi:opacity protein-like surface antigen
MRPLTALLTLATLGLSAQEYSSENRMGVGFSILAPVDNLGTDFGTGFQAGLQIFFNRESSHLGRLRMDYLQSDSKHAIQTGTVPFFNGATIITVPQFANSRMEAYSVAYEWMPHLDDQSRLGLFGIFGMGGTLWNETLRASASSGGGTHTEAELGFTLSAGIGWRFNPHAAMEARFVYSDLAFDRHPNYGSTRSYLTFGTSLRF